MTWGLNRFLRSNKPTRYLQDYGHYIFHKTDTSIRLSSSNGMVYVCLVRTLLWPTRISLTETNLKISVVSLQDRNVPLNQLCRLFNVAWAVVFSSSNSGKKTSFSNLYQTVTLWGCIDWYRLEYFGFFPLRIPSFWNKPKEYAKRWSIVLIVDSSQRNMERWSL